MHRRLTVFAALAALILSSCSLLAFQQIRARSTGTADVELERDLRPAPRSAIADTVEKVLTSVVNVRVTAEIGGGETEGEGSGVIIDESGVVLTNAHVVEHALSVEVAFNDGRDDAEGRVLGAIPNRDLAIVQLPDGDYDAVTIGSSDNLRLGDDVIAIGYPLGLGGPTVTQGIISGEARQISTDTATGQQVNLRDLLQTDAAINPGNSGGPLLDGAGRLVGINTAVAGFAENVGFAIAIDKALPIVEELLENPAPENAWLGVETNVLDPESAIAVGLEPDSPGVIVVNVVPGTPAEEAGLEEGDVIVSVGGEAIADPIELTEVITEHDPGDRVDILVVSSEGRRTIEVRLGLRPGSFPLQ